MSSDFNPDVKGPLPGVEKPALDEKHTKIKGYRQRMSFKDWMAIPFDQKVILFRGKRCMLKARNVGDGMVDVLKGYTEK